MQVAFHQSELAQPHPARARAIIKAHPEVRQLMVRNPYTALIALSLVIMQTAIAYWMGTLGFGYWWLSLLIAYCIGAFANHANYVIIHDATHNLIFRSKSWNKMVAIIADLPNLTPGAMGFRVYHLKHHSHQGDYEYDADLANHWEARLVGNKWYRKAIWLMFFPFFQLTRPPAIEGDHDAGPLVCFESRLRNRLTMWRSFISVAGLDCSISRFHFFSPLVCTRSARAGSRSITQTIPTRRRTAITARSIWCVLNMGYHNEHHDLPSIPWHNLPKLRAMAPEFYNNLKYHTSWTRLLFQFIFDKRYSLFSQGRANETIHESRGLHGLQT